jgi:hypothetical protein
MDLLISAVTHRSGSTLLQRIFNARKENLIWGEQGGALSHFVSLRNSVLNYSENMAFERENYFNNNEDPNTWIACMTPSKKYLESAIKEMVDCFFKKYYDEFRVGHDFIGFKEVRYGVEELKLFRSCFPAATIILLVRNPIDTWKSAIGTDWYMREEGGLEPFVKKWVNHSESYINYSQNDSRTYLIRYEDIFSNLETRNTIKTIGNIDDHEIDAVLKKKLYSSSTTISDSDTHYILLHCRRVVEKLGYCINEYNDSEILIGTK